jgi:urea transporter
MESTYLLEDKIVKVSWEFGFSYIHTVMAIKELFRKNVISRNRYSLLKLVLIGLINDTRVMQSLMVSGGIPTCTDPIFFVLIITPPLGR